MRSARQRGLGAPAWSRRSSVVSAMKVSVDSSGPTSDPIPPRTPPPPAPPPHHTPPPPPPPPSPHSHQWPHPHQHPTPTADPAQTHERPDSFHQEIRAFGRSGR